MIVAVIKMVELTILVKQLFLSSYNFIQSDCFFLSSFNGPKAAFKEKANLVEE
jgi:hypothetical protein